MADLLFESSGTNAQATIGGATTEATIGQDLTAALDVNVQSLRSLNVDTYVESGAQASIATDPTASLEVVVQSLSYTDDDTHVESGAQASIASDLTASLDVSVQSLSYTDDDTYVASGSQASVASDLTAALNVNVASLRNTLMDTSVESGSQASVGLDKTTSLQVNVAVLGFTSDAEAEIGGSTTEASIGQDLTSGLQVNVAVLGFASGPEAEIGGSTTEATLGQDLTASLTVNVASLRNTLTDTSVESGSQASIATDPTASLEVVVQSLSYTDDDTHVESGSQASVAADLTADLQVNVSILGFVYDDVTTIGGSTTEATIGQDLTATLDVNVQSLRSLNVDTYVESGSQASIAADLTASLDVNKDSLTTSPDTSVESGSQASIAADLTASIEVLVQSLTTSPDTSVESGSQASVGLDKTTSLDINVAVLGFASSPDANIGGSTTEATIVNDLSATEDSEVTGSGNLLKSQLIDCDLDIAVAATYTRTAALSVTIKGTETVSASLEMVIAETETETADLSVTIKGTETRTADLDGLVQGTTELTADLDQWIGVTQTLTASLDQIVKATFFRYGALDVYPSPERRFLLDLDALVQGVFTKTLDMSLVVQATELKSVALDLIVEARRPYSLMKLWGHTSTRFFGGTPSDGNFFEHFEPHPAAVINQNIGSISLSDRHVTFQAPNTIPTPAAYDKYSLPFAAPRAVGTVGYRILVCFELRSFGPNNTLLLGAFTGTNDPITDLANGDFVGMAVEAEKGHVEFRAWAGGNESSRAFGLGLPVDRFVNVPLLLEIETVAATAGLTDMEFRLFDRSFNLDRPLAVIPVQTSVPPTTTHFAMTSLGRRTVELPTAQLDMHVDLQYVDVEYGSGTLYEPEYIAPADAKLRCYNDRPPLIMSNQGSLLLVDDLSADQGYWRLDTGTPSTLTFSGGAALVEGGVFAEPSSGYSWTDYQATVEVRPGAAVVGPDGATLAIYGSGTSATGDGYLLTIAYQVNTWYLTKLVGGVSTALTSGTYQYGTLDPLMWHRLTLSGRTDASGETLLHAFVDNNPLAQLTDSAVGPGTVALATGISFPVAFRNLEARRGVNDVLAVLSDSPSSLLFTETQYDTLIVDSSDPVITVVTFTTDSPILVPGTVNPPVVKGSLNPGFSGVAMSWYATHTGTWTLRVNSTGATNGIELRSGTYPVAFETVSTGWDFAELPQVDDTYDVTLYLIADSGKPTAKKLGQYLLP